MSASELRVLACRARPGEPSRFAGRRAGFWTLHVGRGNFAAPAATPPGQGSSVAGSVPPEARP
jgi:hypothetical protein